MSKTVSVEMLDGTMKRIKLPEPVVETRDQISTGLFLEAIYVGRKSKRVIIETDSRWEDRNNPGASIGTRYHEADAEQIARYAAEYRALAEIIDQNNPPESL